MSYNPVEPFRSLRGNGGQPQTRRLAEKASQTFKTGVPVVVETASGYVIESPTLSSALTIAGFSQQAGANLDSSGVAQTLNQGSAQNQPNSVIIPGGAWLNDGNNGVWIADDLVTFAINLKSTQTWAVTDTSKLCGLVKDGTTGQWYADKDITAAGSGAILELLNSIDELMGNTAQAGGLVEVRVTKAGQQFGI